MSPYSVHVALLVMAFSTRYDHVDGFRKTAADGGRAKETTTKRDVAAVAPANSANHSDAVGITKWALTRRLGFLLAAAYQLNAGTPVDAFSVSPIGRPSGTHMSMTGKQGVDTQDAPYVQGPERSLADILTPLSADPMDIASEAASQEWIKDYYKSYKLAEESAGNTPVAIVEKEADSNNLQVLFDDLVAQGKGRHNDAMHDWLDHYLGLKNGVVDPDASPPKSAEHALEHFLEWEAKVLGGGKDGHGLLPKQARKAAKGAKGMKLLMKSPHWVVDVLQTPMVKKFLARFPEHLQQKVQLAILTRTIDEALEATQKDLREEVFFDVDSDGVTSEDIQTEIEKIMKANMAVWDAEY